MVASSSTNFAIESNKFNSLEQSKNKQSKVKRIRQNGQIQIYQSSYRGSFSTIIRDSLRNAALGRKVLLAQLMKGGVKQGISKPIKLCGNLIWIRASDSYDKYDSGSICENRSLEESIKDSIIQLWDFCSCWCYNRNYFNCFFKY